MVARYQMLDFRAKAREFREARAQRSAAAAAAMAIPNKTVLTKAMAYVKTGYAFSPGKKWRILSVIFAVQISMNWNAAIWGNVASGVQDEFHISGLSAALGGALFLITYAFGCEGWAPFSEEFGRKGILQWSLFLVNVFSLLCAVATPSNQLLCLWRFLGGLSSAGGSVTLGIVADMWEPMDHQYALSFVVLSSVAGSAVAPVLGGYLETHMSWRWIFGVSSIIGLVVQVLHFFLVPETRTTCLLDAEAKRLRALNPADNVWGPGELRGSLWSRMRNEPRQTAREMGVLMWRPYKMLFTEKIVCCLSLLSGFSDMLVFVGLSSYGMVLREYYNFGTVDVGLSFIALLAAYLLAYLVYLGIYWQQRKQIKRDPNSFRPEQRLHALNILVWGMPLGLTAFAFTGFGNNPAFPLACLFVIGVANFAIYQATIDYMVAAYGEYAASATGGNGFCRDFLAGTAMLWAKSYYKMTPGLAAKWKYAPPTGILALLAFGLCVPVIIFYMKGEKIRANSTMAREVIEKEKAERAEAAQAEMTDLAPAQAIPASSLSRERPFGKAASSSTTQSMPVEGV